MREAKVIGEVDLTESDEGDILTPSESPSKSVESLSQQKKEEGNRLFSRGSYVDALRLYSEAIGLCPLPVYFTNRSQCYFKLGNFESALEDAKSAIELDPKFVKGYLRVAACNIIFGDFNSAKKNIDLAEQNADSKTITEVISVKDRVEKLCKFLSDFEKCWQKQDWRAVVYYASQVIESSPKNYSLLAKKIEALIYQKKIEEALNLSSDLLRADDKNVDGLFVRGLCFFHQDNFEKATSHLKRALQLCPDHTSAKSCWNKMKSIRTLKEEASGFLKNGEFNDALRLYDEALAVDQSNDKVNSKIHFNISLCYSKLKKHKEALESLNKALSLDSEYTKACMKRVQVYMDLEMFDEAVREAEIIFRKEKTQDAKFLLEEAKAALKKSKQKDYYRILGVGRDASDDEIRKAYKKKALIHHPDRHSNSSESEKKDNEKKFKDLGEAYAVLSDKNKRIRYDNGQDQQEYSSEFPQYDPSEIFASFFAGAGAQSFGGPHFTFTTGSTGGTRSFPNGGFRFQ